MSKKSFQDELADLEDWKGSIHVRHRWVEHEEPRRHGAAGDWEERPAKRKPRRRHPQGSGGPQSE